MNKAQRSAIFETFKAHNPEPTTELNYRSPFELLIAVILSAQATDIAVNQVTAALYPKANTPAAIAALGEAGLRPYLQRLGLFRMKTKNVIATCQQLLALHNGQVPAQRAALEALPGVGRKTANVILNTIFGEPTIAVDTHIFRVANRIGLAHGKTVTEVERKLLRAVPPDYRQHAHHWLILHGRYICKARRPLCAQCNISAYCQSADPALDA